MLTLITPTRNRPQCFALAERWFRAQTFRGNVQWIVVNDGDAPYEYTCGQEVIHRKPVPGEGHSLPRNLLAGVLIARGDKVLIYEDDDWISPSYLSIHDMALEDYELVGFTPRRHYNVRYNRWRIKRTSHCNLGSTGMTSAMIPAFVKILKTKAFKRAQTSDVSLWKIPVTQHRIENNRHHVGIKGMPGEKGLGGGHREIGTLDQSPLHTLGFWIGADVEYYRQTLQEAESRSTW